MTSAYAQLGVRPVINACGIYTDLGGACLSPTVWAAATEINSQYASIPELLDRTGEMIARLVGVEAARVAPGASAGLALSAAACIAGEDGALRESLPHTSGVPAGLVMQRGHRYKYTRCAALSGANVVEVDHDRDALVKAIHDGQAAAVLFPAHLDGHDGSLGLSEVIETAHEQGVSVIVDAAYLSYPTDLIGSFSRAGADLACFSAKYFYGPNAGGMILGRSDLIRAVAGLDFTFYESGPYRNFGRALKMDRVTIAATALALAEWLEMDHASRWAGYATRVDRLVARFAPLPGVTPFGRQFTLDERLVEDDVNAVVLRLDGGATHAGQAERLLAEGDPPVRVIVDGDKLVLAVETVPPQDDEILFERTREVLGLIGG